MPWLEGAATVILQISMAYLQDAPSLYPMTGFTTSIFKPPKSVR
jgi:hypothetical protein